MSENIERIYTINLGKVLLSPNNRRAKRAINMIREFAVRHMKTEQIRIDQDLSHKIWERGIRHPPRKIRVKMNKLEDDYILISQYDENIDDSIPVKQVSKDTTPKDTPSVSDVKDTSVIKTEPDAGSTTSKSDIETKDVKAPKSKQETKEKQDMSSESKETSKPTDKTESKPNTKTDNTKQTQSTKSTDKKQESTKSD